MTPVRPAPGLGAPEFEKDEWHAHLTERFRGPQGSSRDQRSFQPSSAPHSAGRLTRDIKEYYLAQDNQERPSKWQQLSEIPTRHELLRPVSVLQEASGPFGNSTWTNGDGNGHNADDQNGWATDDVNGWSTDDKDAVVTNSNAQGGSDDEDEIDDMDSEEPSQFRAFNKVDGGWSSKEKYLRTHYKLLREDAIRKLREGIAAFRDSPSMDESASQGRICLYDNAHIVGVTFSQRGLGIKLSFSLARVGKKIRWDQSKRLITGALVILIPYEASEPDVSALKVAVVAARPLLELNKNPPQIDLFFANPEEVEIDRSKKWLMLEERAGFFEAERHTLMALQKMVHEKTPLCDHLVSAQNKVYAPDYVQKQPSLDLREAFEGGSGPENVLDRWPKEPQTNMDTTQQEALWRILTKKLAIVQGPPGTGKTFVSVKALRIMLDNHCPGDPPIIITCQTNHALDQLLRHVALVDPECFVRLGGRSKDKEIIKPRTIYEIREKAKVTLLRSNTKGMASKDIRRIATQMQRTLGLVIESMEDDSAKEISDEDEAPINLEVLKGYDILNEDQCKSIEQVAKQWSTAGKSESEQNALFKWAGTAIQASGNPTTAPDFFDFEETELTAEEIQEIEAEAAPVDDDDLEYLSGDYYRIKPWLSGKANNSSKPSRYIIQGTGGRKGYTDADRLLKKNTDLGRVEKNSRPALLDYMVTTLKAKICDNFRNLAVQYDRAIKQKKIGMWEEDEALLRQHKVVGLTTTGFSKYRGLIHSLHPRMVLIEEAAEALESPVIATCVESLEHLVLIGDHMQLRPHLRILELARDPYYLDTSLFERMVSNGVEFTRLERQRRMVPEIRRLLGPIYGEGVIKDHPDVSDERGYRPPIPGMGKYRSWFFHHTWPEAKDDQLSTYNVPEATMILGLVKYLYLNNFPLSLITILTFYNGQRRELVRQIKDSPIAELRESLDKLKIVTVDAYQGEENGLVILSLVRSNLKENIGFLNNMNRVCVSLSRAQRGFYMFGNAILLRRAHETWRAIYDLLKKDESLASSTSTSTSTSNVEGGTKPTTRFGKFKFPLGPCAKHNRVIELENPGDWLDNMGGCDVACGSTLKCGHTCPHPCHPLEHGKLRCLLPCGRSLGCGHVCRRVCADECQCKTCDSEELPTAKASGAGGRSSPGKKENGKISPEKEKAKENGRASPRKEELKVPAWGPVRIKEATSMPKPSTKDGAKESSAQPSPRKAPPFNLLD